MALTLRPTAPVLQPLRNAASPSRHQLDRKQLRTRHRTARCGVPAPGRYGGPPLDRRLRPMWGGQRTKDPITESGDYLWDNKKEWQRLLDQEAEGESRREEEGGSEQQSSRGSGFLSLTRSLALDSVQLDLSTELTKESKADLQHQVAAAQQWAGDAALSETEQGGKSGVVWRAVREPSARQLKKMEKSASKGLYGVVGTQGEEGGKSQQEQEEAAFQELKKSLIVYTAALGAAFTASAALTYSPPVAVSLGVGSLSSLMYIRMLSSSVEALGSSGLANAAKGGLGQPRFLVPMILVAAYNRWNAIIVPEYGVVELQLIPMLLGFFTYKAATIVRTFQDLLLPPADPPSTSP